jgi:hypothetical protein
MLIVGFQVTWDTLHNIVVIDLVHNLTLVYTSGVPKPHYSSTLLISEMLNVFIKSTIYGVKKT